MLLPDIYSSCDTCPVAPGTSNTWLLSSVCCLMGIHKCCSSGAIRNYFLGEDDRNSAQNVKESRGAEYSTVSVMETGPGKTRGKLFGLPNIHSSDPCSYRGSRWLRSPKACPSHEESGVERRARVMPCLHSSR
eukprot:6183352-Pleurochrysis_carterae.AAC.1